MFPPPQPWKSVAAVDPDQTCIAFSSRFALRSLPRLPAFIRHSLRIQKQVRQAPGVIGYTLGADLFRLHFYTLSAWQDEQSLMDFAHATPHVGSTAAFQTDMRTPSLFRKWTVRGADLPLSWADALARHAAEQEA